MNTDIRLKTTFTSHPKIMRLRLDLGADAVLSLIALWMYVAQNRPHGELRGLDEKDVELASQWRGVEGQFVGALLRLRLLDKKGKLFLVHDWEDHNPWAFHAPERKAKAKKASDARWGKNNGKTVCSEHVLALPDDAKATAPSPSPSPSPNTPLPPKGEVSEKERMEFFEQLWEAYPKKDGKKAALRHYKASVKTDSDMNRINAALQNYLNNVQSNDLRFIKNGSTIFNDWEDFVPKEVDDVN